MFLNVYDQNVNQVGVIDVFISLIWTKRYNSPGDFEVVMPLDGYLPDYITPGNYVSLNEDLESGYYMIIETVYVDQNPEDGLTLTINGRSLEALLDRRIIWAPIIYENKKGEIIIKDLIEKSITKPSLTKRKISNFLYQEPQESVKSSSMTAEYDGQSLLEVLPGICSEDHNSISVRYLNGKFVYETYTGTNRSHDQTEVDEVLYSPSFDSLASSKYLESIKNYKNVIQISISSGETAQTVAYGDAEGIERREKRETLSNITDPAYLKTMGNLLLYQNKRISALEGEAINDVYVYGRDVFVGDIVQFANGYGIEAKARITEYIFSEDLNGINNYPSFAIIDDSTTITPEE